MIQDLVAHIRQSDKEVQSLERHLKETGDLAKKFSDKVGLGKIGYIAGLMHDFGKASDEFQRYIKSANDFINYDEDEYIDPIKSKGKIDHSTAGAQMIKELIPVKTGEDLLLSQLISLLIASHHSGLIDCLSPDGRDAFGLRMLKPEGKSHFKECKLNISRVLGVEVFNNFSWESLSKLIKTRIMAIKERDPCADIFFFKWGLLTRFLFSCLIDADRVNTADFEFPGRVVERNSRRFSDWSVLVEKLNTHLKMLETESRNVNPPKMRELNTIRKRISDSCLSFGNMPKGLYKLSVPTGGGKTLSSLRFALKHAEIQRMDRIFYVIPFTSIIDQNARKTSEILESNMEGSHTHSEIVLEHHSNLTPEDENPHQKLLAENWDAQIIFTTMVKFLESIYGKGTRDARRMHNLANSVIIFDEVQSVPIKCVHIFNMAVQFLVEQCGSTVVLCTATQPLLDKVEPPNRALKISAQKEIYPDFIDLFEELKRVAFYDKRKARGWEDSEITSLVMEELELSGNVLVVVNTKKSAKRLAEQLKKLSQDAVYHLSTNMCPQHRIDVLDEIKIKLRDGDKVICVSTQLIEAGIDIDFGSVIRYLAGLDSLVQAAGRCNRNGKMGSLGRFIVINPKNENLKSLRDISSGQEVTQRILDEYKKQPQMFDNDVLGPKGVEMFYKYFFYEKKEEMSYRLSPESLINRNDNIFNLLSTNGLSFNEYKRINKSSPNLFLKQSFMSASKSFDVIGTGTNGVIVPYKEGERIIEELCGSTNLEYEYKLLKSAQRFSIDIFDNQFEKLRKNGILQEIQRGAGIFYIGKSYYKLTHGLDDDVDDEMPFYNS